LQAAVGRNNASTNYGQRAEQVNILNELDPEGTIIPTLAGSNVNTFRPRGLNAAVTLGAGIPAAYTNPLTLLAAPAFMPRVVGELAYGTGVAAGYGKRGLDAVTGSPVGKRIADTGSDIAELYNKYPQLFLAEAQLGTKLQETEQERLERMYAGAMPSIPADASFEGYVPPETTQQAAPAMVAPVAAVEPPPAAASAPVGEETIFTVGDVQAKFDPVQNDYYDIKNPNNRVKELADFADPPLGMYRGGPVQRFGNGGQPSFTDRARSAAKGATFAFNDEIEAGLRALARLDPSAYQREVQKIRAQQARYEDQNPLESIAYEMGGSLLPAFIPGGQGVTAARLGSLGARAASLAAKAPRTAMMVRRAAPVAAGATAYGAGSANSMRDIPRSVRDEALVGLGLYGAGRFAAKPAKAGYRKVRSIFR
jgi:hypothetical protein